MIFARRKDMKKSSIEYVHGAGPVPDAPARPQHGRRKRTRRRAAPSCRKSSRRKLRRRKRTRRRAGETTAEAVAKVTMTASDGATWSKEYTDLLEAFDAACVGRWTEGGIDVDADTVSVELLKHGETYTLKANEAFPIRFAYSHSVIIDLNGCTLKRTVSETQQGILEVRDSGNVTLKNGTLELDDSESLNPAQAIDMPINGGNPTLTLENMTITVADIPENSSRDDQGYAINAKGGTLDLQGDTLLDGGLTMTGDARLKKQADSRQIYP